MIHDKPILAMPAAARDYLERVRWPDEAWCIHCGLVGSARRLRQGGTTRQGLWKCSGCRRQFTVTVGTIFEDSHLPLNQWLQAIQLCVEKTSVSSADLRRALGVTHKTARLLAGRLGYALTQPLLARKTATAGRISFMPLSFDEAVEALVKVIPEKRLDSADRLDRQERLHRLTRQTKR